MKTCSLFSRREHDILFPALEQSMMAVVLINENNQVMFFNESAEQLWGYSRQEVLGKDVNMLVPGVLRSRHPSFISHNRTGGQSRVVGMNRELQLERKDGLLVWTSFALSRVRVDGGIYYLAMARDVTAEVEREEQNRLLLLAVNHTDRPVIVLSPACHIIQANNAFIAMTGYDRDGITGKNIEDILFPAGLDTERLKLRVLLKSRESGSVQDELQAVTRNGDIIWIKVSVSRVEDNAEHIRNLVVTFIDISENQKIRMFEKDVLAALATEQLFSDTGLMICQQVSDILSGAGVTLYYREGETMLLWASSSDSRGLASDDSPDKLRAHQLTWDIPHYSDNSIGGMLALDFSGPIKNYPFTERIADTCIYLCTLALEQAHYRQQVERLAQFDTLTGLPNRTKLHQYIDLLLRETPDNPVALLSLVIDNFSAVNDILGYVTANQCLLIMVNRLQSILRPGQYLSRTEGIQFVLVLPECDASDASSLAGRLKKLMSEPVCLSGETFRFTVSIGISLYPEGNRDSLLSAAWSAMEHIRSTGGDNWQFYNPAINLRMKEDLHLGMALKKAIGENRLTLNYQPQILTGSEQLYGVEALARWHHPDFGYVPPPRFVALAEKNGDTGSLGYWVLHEACRQMAEWRNQGILVPVVSINLSPRNFLDPELPSEISATLQKYQLEGSCLTIEITENDMMELTGDMTDRLYEIRKLGVGLSVDDFGTGFSGLSNLANLPVTEIKIDKSFIDNSLNNQRTKALTEAITGIAHSLRLIVVAEGVETSGQLAFLKTLNCTVIQGYLYSRPLPPDAFREWYMAQQKHRP